jgi:uncharacterized membrane protein
MLEQIIRLFSPADWLAFGLILFGWTSNRYHADPAARSQRRLRGVTSHMRLDWARQMVARDNRITHTGLTGNLMISVSFCATTKIYIIAGLIAVAGTLDPLIRFTADLPFAKQTTKSMLEAKLSR